LKFSFNQNLQAPGSKTSCIEVIKSSKRAYPWLSVNITNSTFTSNVGSITNSIYFD